MDKQCRECGGELAFHGYKHTEKVGRWTVTDTSSMAWQCMRCQLPQLTLDDLQGYQLRAVKTALCSGKFEGSVVRYARKALGLTQKEIGTVIGYQHETVSRWENDKEEMPRAASVSIVGILCRVIDGESAEDILDASRQVQEQRSDGPAGGTHRTATTPQARLRVI
jgi:DNA-binding transcriptional regulator YiaG